MSDGTLPELMTVKETAEYLKVTPQYVRILCSENVLDYVRVGTEYRIFRDRILNSLQKAFICKELETAE